VKRIIEGVVIAVLSSAITWAAGHWSDARQGGERAWPGAASELGRFESAAWLIAGVAIVLALGAMAVRRARSSEPGFWELDLNLPSPAMVMTATGVVAGMTAYGSRLSGNGSLWGMPLLGLATYIALRSLVRLRWSLRALLGTGGM
jgi:hypothetical protein